MTREEFERELKTLEEKHTNEKRELFIRCAKSNQKYKTGDVITDHAKTIQVDHIRYQGSRFGCLPQAVYYGYVLKKDGTKRKDEKRDCIYQSNIIKS